jgi:hypothetical protein
VVCARAPRELPLDELARDSLEVLNKGEHHGVGALVRQRRAVLRPKLSEISAL